MRTRGTDNRWTEGDVCLIIDHTNERALLVGGRGEAEQIVDMLEGNQLEKFNYKGNKQFYKPLLHGGNTQACGLGLPVVKYDTVIFWPNKARVDVRLFKPGVAKDKPAVPPKAARYLAMDAARGDYLPRWFREKYHKPPSPRKPEWVYDIDKEEWIER